MKAFLVAVLDFTPLPFHKHSLFSIKTIGLRGKKEEAQGLSPHRSRVKSKGMGIIVIFEV